MVPPIPRQRRGVGGGAGLLPGQQSTNHRAAEGEDPPHSRHPQEAVTPPLSGPAHLEPVSGWSQPKVTFHL